MACKMMASRLARSSKAFMIVDGGRERQRREMTDAWNRHQASTNLRSLGLLLHVGVDRCNGG
jgi:hypothetical protein